MKKGKIFPAVLYFIFTFLVGFVLALILTPMYLYGGMLLDTLSDDLYEKKYDDAMKLVGGYYNGNVLYSEDLGKDGKGGIVIYETVTLGYPESNGESGDENNEASRRTILQKSYVAFLFGVKDEYPTSSTKDNKTALLLKVGGEDKTYEILDTDSDGDGVKDQILTYESKGIVIAELTKKDYSSVESISFVDKDGRVFYTKSFETPLDYSSDFYNDIDGFMTAYNDESAEDALLKQKEAEFLENKKYKKSDYGQVKKRAQDKTLKPIIVYAEFLENTDYKKSDYGQAEKRAQDKATKTIIIYFVVVYVIADFLFTRFIIKFVRFLLFKVFKIKRKEKQPKTNTESFGGDYYCAITMKISLQENLSFDGDVTVSYGEGDKTVAFTLRQAEGYEKYLRVKAGLYGNLTVAVPDGYKLEGLPETLVAEGYKKTINATLVRQED